MHTSHRKAFLKGFFKTMKRASILFYSSMLISCSALTCVSCATTNSSAKASVAIDWKLSKEAEETFQFLRFYRALLDNNTEEFVNAANKLTTLNPNPSIIGESAVMLLMQGQITEARTLAQKGLKIDPKDERLNYLLIETYTREKRFNDALELLLEYQKGKKESVDSQQEIARLFLLSNRGAEAIKYILAMPKRGPILDYYLGQAYLDQENVAKAEQELLKAIQKAPDFSQPILSLALLYEQQKQWVKASKMRQKLYDIEPENSEYAGLLIFDLLQSKDFKKIDSILNDSPQQLSFLLDVASVMFEHKQYEQAEKVLLKILKGENIAPADSNSAENEPKKSGSTNSSSAEQKTKTKARPAPKLSPEERKEQANIDKDDAYYLLGAVAYEHKKDPDAAAKMLALVPEKSRYFQNSVGLRAHILAEQNKIQEALESLELAIKKDPESFILLKAKADVYLFAKDYPKAIEFLKLLTLKFPDSQSVAYALGAALEENEQTAEALVVMEELINKFPMHIGALNYVGYTLADQNKDLDKAERLLELAYSQDPNSYHIIDSLAWVKYRLKDYNEAWKLINKATKAAPKSEAIIWEHYAEIATALDKKDEALKGYQNAIDAGHKKPELMKEKISKVR